MTSDEAESEGKTALQAGHTVKTTCRIEDARL
jgi:hypothetical protein